MDIRLVRKIKKICFHNKLPTKQCSTINFSARKLTPVEENSKNVIIIKLYYTSDEKVL